LELIESRLELEESDAPEEREEIDEMEEIEEIEEIEEREPEEDDAESDSASELGRSSRNCEMRYVMRARFRRAWYSTASSSMRTRFDGAGICTRGVGQRSGGQGGALINILLPCAQVGLKLSSDAVLHPSRIQIQ